MKTTQGIDFFMKTMIFTRQNVNVAVLGLVFLFLRFFDGVIGENAGNALRRSRI